MDKPGILQGKTEPAPQAAPAADDLSPASIMAKMHVNEKQKPQLARIVEAGKRVMFDKKTHYMMLESMNGDGPIEQKIGGGVVSLLGILWKESKQSLPPELIVPAGAVLVAEACDFLNQSGSPVTPEQQGGATEFMLDTLLQAAKVDSNKLAAASEQSRSQTPNVQGAPAAQGAAQTSPAGVLA